MCYQGQGAARARFDVSTETGGRPAAALVFVVGEIKPVHPVQPVLVLCSGSDDCFITAGDFIFHHEDTFVFSRLHHT